MKRVLVWLLAAVCLLGVAGYGAFRLSPWPSVLLIRMTFDKGANAASAALAKHVPPGIVSRMDEPYDPADPAALLNVHRPAAAGDTPLPVIVWVHGGAFVYGRRDNVDNYLKVLAGQGFATVAVGYALAPGATYPAPLRQLNTALGHLQQNASRLGLDMTRVALAGDSAGAQIVGQFANIVTSPAHAGAVGIVPALRPGQLRAMVLHCGPYGIAGIDLDGPFGGFLRTVLWSYFGTRDFQSDPRLRQFDVSGNLTAAFPPAFISVGNADPLAPLSHELDTRLRALGVAVETLFFPPDHQPPLGHEYQFDLDTAAGRLALERSVAFLAARFSPPP